MHPSSTRLIVLCLLIPLLLSACQTAVTGPEPATATATARPSSTPQPSATPQPTATATPPWLATLTELEGLQVRFAHPWAGEMARQFDLLVDQFNQNNEWGIHVIARASGSPEALFSDLFAQQESGDLPEMAAVTSDEILALAAGGVPAADLSEFTLDANYGYDLMAVAPVFRPDPAAKPMLGLPLLAESQVLLYNSTWAQELGFNQTPRTPHELQEQLCAATFANATDQVGANDGTGGWYIQIEPLTMLSWLGGFGFAPASSDGELEYHFDQRSAEETFLYLRGLVDENCAWLGRQPTPYDYFATRQALVTTSSVLDIPIQARAGDRLEAADEWVVLPFPHQSGTPVTFANLTSVVVLESTPAESLASWLFARWLAQPEPLARLARAEGYIPASLPGVEEMSDYRSRYPQWGQAADLLEAAQLPPQRASWPVVAMILRDAGWQTMQSYITTEQVPDLLIELEETIQEVGRELGYQ